MRRIFVPIIILLFGIAIGGIMYHGYINMRSVDETILWNTNKTIRTSEAVKLKLDATAEALKIKLEDTAEALKIKLEDTAEVVRTRLDVTNHLLVTNQEDLKVAVAEVIEQQIYAVAKDLLTQEVYRRDIIELNKKLDKLLEQK